MHLIQFDRFVFVYLTWRQFKLNIDLYAASISKLNMNEFKCFTIVHAISMNFVSKKNN